MIATILTYLALSGAFIGMFTVDNPPSELPKNLITIEKPSVQMDERRK